MLTSAGCSTTAQRVGSVETRAAHAVITKAIADQESSKPKQTPPPICKQKVRRIEIKPGQPAWLDQADWLQSADEQDSRTAFCHDLLRKALNE